MHLNIVELAIVWAPVYDIMSGYPATSRLKSLRRVLCEVLTSRDGHGKHEIVPILSDLIPDLIRSESQYYPILFPI